MNRDNYKEYKIKNFAYFSSIYSLKTNIGEMYDNKFLIIQFNLNA